LKKLKVLVACEESQVVTIEFRKLGHEAYSCDTQDCSGGHPEWHIKGDVRYELYKKWDLIIAHPPCTRLADSGVMWLEKRNLWEQMYKGCDFFKLFQKYPYLANSAVAIENPIPHKYAVKYIGKYSQIIQPYQFGHLERKATCLWLYGLPKLKETENVYTEMIKLPKKFSQRCHYTPPGKDRVKIRSKTFPGIARAMATQWSEYLTKKI
jgi:hypothetical protein